jgi:hypothetical protein
VKKPLSALVLLLAAASFGHAEDTSFRSVRMPDAKGRQVKAVLTFSDTHKAIEVRSPQGDSVTIPYNQIDRCSYEFTKRHHLAPSGLITRSKSHWLEIDYREGDSAKTFVLHMEKRDYIHILDALKSHTGVDAEILGNANKGINKN